MRLGFITLMWYLLICLFSYLFALWLPGELVFTFALIATVTLWYDAMNKNIIRSIFTSIIVTLFFVIPSFILTGLKQWASINQNNYFEQFNLLYNAFHAPFSTVNVNSLDDLGALIHLLGPAIIISLVFIIVLGKYIINFFRASNDYYVMR